MLNLKQYAAVDPLSLVLPSSLYVIIAEMKHPHVSPEIVEALRALPADQKRTVATNAKNMAAYYNAVQAAAGG